MFRIDDIRQRLEAIDRELNAARVDLCRAAEAVAMLRAVPELWTPDRSDLHELVLRLEARLRQLREERGIATGLTMAEIGAALRDEMQSWIAEHEPDGD